MYKMISLHPQERAATKIQACFRATLGRNEYAAKKWVKN